MKVSRTDELDKQYFQAIIYSYSGVGKTTLCSEAKRPVFLDFDHGTEVIQDKSISVIYLDTVKELDDLVEGLIISPEKTWKDLGITPPIETLIIDSLTEMQSWMMERLIISNPAKTKRYFKDMPVWDDWGLLYRYMRRFMINLRKVPCNVIYTASVAETKSEEFGATRMPALRGQLGGEAPYLVGIIGYMAVEKINGEDKRVLYFSPSTYFAKTRFPELPDRMENPTFKEIYKIINRKKVAK